MQQNFPKTIYIVRHGQTKGNTIGQWLGARSTDPLNEYGKKQARSVAKKLNEININTSKIFSSPTVRALETAEIIQRHSKRSLSIEKINSLTEINLGILEDRTREQGIRLVPQEIKDWKENLKEFNPPLGESALEAAERFYESVELISKTYPKKDVLFVTHGVVTKMFLAKVLDASMKTGEKQIKVPWTRHGSISMFSFDGQSFKFKKVVENKYPDSDKVAAYG